MGSRDNPRRGYVGLWAASWEGFFLGRAGLRGAGHAGRRVGWWQWVGSVVGSTWLSTNVVCGLPLYSMPGENSGEAAAISEGLDR